MMSVTMKIADAHACEVDASVRADDPRLRRRVVVIHHDGSLFNLNYAFLELYDVETAHGPETFVIVYTEHHGHLTFAWDDLDHFAEYSWA